MNRKIIYLSLLLIFVSTVYAQDYFHGKLTEDTKWSGIVYLDGDVIVPANVRLLIEPGTKIIISPNTDALRKGKDKGKVDIVVKGGFVAKGTPESRIIFTSGSPEPMMADWYGIYIKSKQNTCILDFVTIEYAYFGVSVVNSKPIIKNCEIRYNYMAGINVDLNAEPKIIGCAITANDYAGIKCDYGAKPVISDCIISENSHGIIAFKQAEPNLGTVNRRGGVSGGNNRIFENWEYNIYNHTISTIYAQNNNWLTNNASEIEKTIYDKADDAQYGSVIYKPVYVERAEPEVTVAQSTPVDQPPAEEMEASTAENEQTPAPEVTTPQNQTETDVNISPVTTNQQQETKTEPVKNNIEKTEEINEEPPEPVDKPVVTEKIDTQEEAEPQLTAEEKIFADIFSLKKPALEYQLDNKPVKRIKMVAAEYPPSYRASRRPGTVFIRVVVNVDGKVESANVLKVDGGEEFGRSALEAVKQFEYAPGTFRGRSVRYVKTERFVFQP